MILNLYAVRDKIADKVLCVFHSTNNGMAVRENLPALSRVAPINDLELNRIGTIDDVTMEIVKDSPVIVSWDSYKFPESPVKPIKSEDTKK